MRKKKENKHQILKGKKTLKEQRDEEMKRMIQTSFDTIKLCFSFPISSSLFSEKVDSYKFISIFLSRKIEFPSSEGKNVFGLELFPFNDESSLSISSSKQEKQITLDIQLNRKPNSILSVSPIYLSIFTRILQLYQLTESVWISKFEKENNLNSNSFNNNIIPNLNEPSLLLSNFIKLSPNLPLSSINKFTASLSQIESSLLLLKTQPQHFVGGKKIEEENILLKSLFQLQTQMRDSILCSIPL